MKVTVASSGLGHVTRGIETWADDLARALSERDIDIILCKGGGTATRPYERVLPCLRRNSDEAAKVMKWLPRRLTWRVGLGSSYDVEQCTFAAGLIAHLRRERRDILHVQDPGIARLVQRAAGFGLIPTKVILAHGTEEPNDFLRRFMYLQELSPWHLEQVQRAGVAKPTWTAIPNFVDTERFKPGQTGSIRLRLGIPDDALVVLSVAAIKRHHKRIDWLLEEFSQLRRFHPDLPAWLIIAGGRETDTEELVERGKTMLGDRVRFLVKFGSNEMPDLYRSSNVFVLCSLNEMMPIGLLEAMASGLPCLIHSYPVADWMRGPGGLAVDMTRPG